MQVKFDRNLLKKQGIVFYIYLNKIPISYPLKLKNSLQLKFKNKFIEKYEAITCRSLV